ncbi:hypothetical protein JCM39194_10670 [Desulfotomaculum varum]
MRLVVDGREYTGTPLEIVYWMWQDCFHRDSLATIDEYMRWLTGNVFKFTGQGIDIGDGTPEEKSWRLIEGLIELGIAKKA